MEASEESQTDYKALVGLELKRRPPTFAFPGPELNGCPKTTTPIGRLWGRNN